MSASAAGLMGIPLITRRVRAHFAPVQRAAETPTIFDPAQNVNWSESAPPSPWVDLGWISEFKRVSKSEVAGVEGGVPPVLIFQARQRVGASVSFRFATWTKLSMALATGSQHLNVLAPQGGALPRGAGSLAVPATALAANSSATTLYLTSGSYAPGSGAMVVVDQDYAGQVGYVGAPVNAAYVQSASSVGSDPDYIRRVSFNVGRVVAVGSDGGLQLAEPLIGGVPAAGMKVQQVVAMVDREGGSFFQEWSGLFVMEGVQGDRLCFYYPRLQTNASSAETSTALAGELEIVHPLATFAALTVTDAADGEQIACYRTYYPAPAGAI